MSEDRLLCEHAGRYAIGGPIAALRWKLARKCLTARYYAAPAHRGAWEVNLAGKLLISDGCAWWIHGRWFSRAGGKTTRLGRFRAPRL